MFIWGAFYLLFGHSLFSIATYFFPRLEFVTFLGAKMAGKASHLPIRQTLFSLNVSAQTP